MTNGSDLAGAMSSAAMLLDDRDDSIFEIIRRSAEEREIRMGVLIGILTDSVTGNVEDQLNGLDRILKLVNSKGKKQSMSATMARARKVIRDQLCFRLAKVIFTLDNDIKRRMSVSPQQLQNQIQNEVHYDQCTNNDSTSTAMDTIDSLLPWMQPETKFESKVDINKAVEFFMQDVSGMKRRFNGTIHVPDAQGTDTKSGTIKLADIPAISMREKVLAEIENDWNTALSTIEEELSPKSTLLSRNNTTFDTLARGNIIPEFSSEESYGRFLDLNKHYSMYMNVALIASADWNSASTINAQDKKGPTSKHKSRQKAQKEAVNSLATVVKTMKRDEAVDIKSKITLSCLDFIRLLATPAKLADKIRNSQRVRSTRVEYLRCLELLLKYLIDFIRRSLPLVHIDDLMAKSEQNNGDSTIDENAMQEDNSTASTAMDGDGLYCTFCKKQFAKKTVYDGHLTGKKHLKNVEQRNKKSQKHRTQEKGVMSEEGISSPSTNQSEQLSHMTKVRVTERKIASLLEVGGVLHMVWRDTIDRMERRLTLTEEELAREDAFQAEDIELPRSSRKRSRGDLDNDDGSEAESFSSGDVDDDVDEDGMRRRRRGDRVYNPLKLPVGWDGKPIPYWLYKLRGLSAEFPCEICGGFVYRGRMDFDKHFQEARHIYGMQCLNIPNTKQFYGVTSIVDAQNLWRRLQSTTIDVTQSSGVVVGGGGVEEFEDEEGNVYTQ